MPAFSVELDQDRPFHPGDIVTGTVTCIFEMTEIIEDIEVKLRGEEHTSWSGSGNGDCENGCRASDKTDTGDYYGHSRFLANRTSLSTPGKCFEPGKYIFQFIFQLPKYVPGSYHHGNDYIRYYVKLNIKIANQKVIKFVKMFNVSAPFDSKNIKSKAKHHVLEITEEGPVTLEASLKKNTFEIGELMKVKAKVSNPSRLQIDRIEAELGMEVEAVLLHPRKRVKTCYILLSKNEAASDGDVYKTRKYIFELRVPNIPNFDSCKLFRSLHVVQVRAVLPDSSEDVVVTIPVMLGRKLPSRSPTSPRSMDDLQDDGILNEDISVDIEDFTTYQVEMLPSKIDDLHISNLVTSPEIRASAPTYNVPSAPYPHQIFDPPYPPPLSIPTSAPHPDTLQPTEICRNIGFDMPILTGTDTHGDAHGRASLKPTHIGQKSMSFDCSTTQHRSVSPSYGQDHPYQPSNDYNISSPWNYIYPSPDNGFKFPTYVGNRSSYSGSSINCQPFSRRHDGSSDYGNSHHVDASHHSSSSHRGGNSQHGGSSQHGDNSHHGGSNRHGDNSHHNSSSHHGGSSHHDDSGHHGGGDSGGGGGDGDCGGRDD